MFRVAQVVLLVLLLLLNACGMVVEETRPDPGAAGSASAARSLVIQSHPERPSIQVSEEQFREAMRWLLQDVHVPTRMGALSGGLGVLPVVGEPFDALQLAADYQLWCGVRHHQRGDCLGLLKDGFSLGREGRYQIAFDIALGAQWDGFMSELRGLVDATAVRAFLLGAMVGYMALLAFPEIVTKGIAAAVTVVLAAWLGVQTVWNLVAGYLRMVAEADAARTFDELRAAGERYGQLIGANTARVLVMAITAALSQGGLVSKVLQLPGAAQASVALAAESGGTRLAALGQVNGVVVTGSSITVVLAPAAGAQVVGVAMTASGSRSKILPRGSLTPPLKPVDIKLRYKEVWTEEQRADARAKVAKLNEAKNKAVVKGTDSLRESKTSAVERLRSNGRFVPKGCEGDHCVDLQLNGEDTLSNLWPLDSSVNRSLGSQIHHAIKNLPAGTPIGTITID